MSFLALPELGQSATSVMYIYNDLTLSEPVAFDPRVVLNMFADKTLTLSASANGSYALPQLYIKHDQSITKIAPISNPEAIASIEKLKLEATIPAVEYDNKYLNLSAPFLYTVDGGELYPLWLTTESSVPIQAQPRERGIGRRSRGKTGFAHVSPVRHQAFISLPKPRPMRGGGTEPVRLEYAYGVTGKSADWQSAHFGWNVVNSGALWEKAVTFSDPNISVIQFLTSDGGYTTVTPVDGGFTLAPYTAYFAQATAENTTVGSGQLRASETPLSEAVLELLAPDGTVADRILATAGAPRRGRNVQKMGVGSRNLYIDKEGMKCAAPDEAGTSAVRVTGKDLNLRLASVTGGVTASWNGVSLGVGESFAAADGTLHLFGEPTGNEATSPDLFRVWTAKGQIHIEGPADRSPYCMTTAGGVTVATGRMTAGSATVAVAAEGVYFVSVGNRSFKVIVK